ncbi:MAG: GAF domain-containing protein, partial [Candidatus Methylomirabilis sp.]
INHITVMTPSARSIVDVTRAGKLPTGVDYSDRPYLRAVIAARTPQLSAPLLGRVSRNPEVFLAVPVLDRRGALKVILVGGLDTSELYKRHLFEPKAIVPGVRTLLLEPSGRPVASSDRTLAQVFASPSGVPIAPKPWETAPSLMAWTDEQGQQMVGASATLATWKWSVLSGIPEDQIRDVMAAPVRRLGYTVLWLLLGCVIVSPLVARIMAAPILALQRQAKRIAEGRLGEQVTPAHYPPRELVELSHTINAMSGQIARHYRETSAVGIVARSVNQSLDLHEILQGSLWAIADVITMDAGLIYLVEGTELRATAHLGLSDEFVQGTDRMPLGEGLSGRVAESGAPLVVEDLWVDPRSRFSDLVKAEGLHSLASVPLTSKGRTLGVLNIMRHDIRGFSEDELSVMTTIGVQIGLAVENASLYSQARGRLKEAETLLAVGKAVSSTLDLQETLRRGARELAHALHADTAGAYLVSPDGQALSPFSGYHLPKEQLEYLRTTAIPLHWNRFIEEAFTTRRAIFSSDCQLDPRFDEKVKLFSVRAVVMVPFFAKDLITGCLFGIWWDQPHTPTSRELELAEGIGRQLALAVENSRLHKESLDRAEALAQSEDRYRRLAEGAMDLIFTVDVNGRFTYLNSHVHTVLGYSPEELLGKPSIALVAPKDHDLLRETFARALRGESAFDVYEVEAIKKDGSTISLEVGASTIYDAEGRVIGRQGIARDLTERRRLEEEVQERKRLEEINQFKSQFLANMSHELRTPLN